MSTPLSEIRTSAELEARLQTTYDALKKAGANFSEDDIKASVRDKLKEAGHLTDDEINDLFAGVAGGVPTSAAKPATPAEEPEKAFDPSKTTENVEEVAKVVATGGRSYFWMKPQISDFVTMFFELRRKVGPIGNMLFTGPSGSGKTEFVFRKAEELGIPFYKFDVASATTDDKWIGRKDIVVEGEHAITRFSLSEFLKWVSADGYAPGVVLLDEVNRVHPSRANIIFALLDGSQAIFVPDIAGTVLPDGSLHDGYIHVHPHTIVVATANIGSQFGGTYSFDHAFKERFQFTVEMPWPPTEAEVEILEKRTGIDTKRAQLLVEIAQKSRLSAAAGDLTTPISTRMLLASALLVAAGMPTQQAAEFTFLPAYSDEGGPKSERMLLRQLLQGKTPKAS